ncbi:MAG: sulfurtransferase complex subunit TusB [Halioglobus sp.]|nr:sulfurtransferase complex subunit TusB [Halioglobus sp.]
MILHTLNAAPSEPAFADCLRALQPRDTLLLLGDGVYALLPGSAGRQALLARQLELYILESDARAAGLDPADGAAQAVDMDGFVALTERLPTQMAWY